MSTFEERSTIAQPSHPEAFNHNNTKATPYMAEKLKSPSGSAKDMNQSDPFLSPDELSIIKVTDLSKQVKLDPKRPI